MLRKIIQAFLLLCLVFGFTNSLHAAIGGSWSEFKFVTEESEKNGEFDKGSYDFDREELTLKFKVFSNKDPREDYRLETQVGDEDCEMDLEYNSFYISGECVLDIAEEDVVGMYEIDINIYDEDDGLVYQRNNFDIEIEGLEDDFDWEDDMQYDALYVMDDEKLYLSLYLEDIVRKPNHEYRIYIDIDGEEYNDTFSYNSSDDTLYADFEIRINEEDIEDTYDLDYEIIDRDDDNEVADDGFDVEVEIESNEDDIDWDEIKYTSYYDSKSNEIDFEFYLEDISKEPYDDYTLFIEVDSEEDDKRFQYDEDEEKFYVMVSIDVDEDDDRFNVEFYVENKDSGKEVYDDKFTVTSDNEDDIDWDDLVISLAYDEKEEELYITFEIEVDTQPKYEYEVLFDIGSDDDDADFEYQASKNRLYKQFVLSIDKEDIEDEYNVEYQVNNIDEDDEVADDDKDIDVDEYVAASNDIDWDELDIELAYDEDEEVLYVVFTQESSETPEDDYSVMFELDGDDYDEDFTYKNGELSAIIEIDIDKEDIEDEYEVDYVVTNEDEDEEVASDTLDVDVEDYEDVFSDDEEDTEEDTNTDIAFNDDWDGIDLEFEYHGPSRKMKALFVLGSFRFNSNIDYELELYLHDGTKIEGDLTYSDALGKMYGTFSTYIATTKVLDEYDVKLYIKEDGTRIHFQEDTYEVDFKDFVYSDKKQDKEEELSQERKDAIEKAISKYADSVFKKYRAKKNAIAHLEIMIVLFEEYKDKNPKYAQIVDHVNEILEDIIDENE